MIAVPQVVENFIQFRIRNLHYFINVLNRETDRGLATISYGEESRRLHSNEAGQAVHALNNTASEDAAHSSNGSSKCTGIAAFGTMIILLNNI